MRKYSVLFAAALMVAFLAGCVAPYGAPVYGGLVTSDVQGPVALGDNSVQCIKTGVAQSTGIILIAMGDASIKKAMENGGITKIHHVDCKVLSVLNLYTKYETIVYGE